MFCGGFLAVGFFIGLSVFVVDGEALLRAETDSAELSLDFG